MTIERVEIEGSPAFVAYLTSDFEPADKDNYDLVKVLFDDGRVVFAVHSDDDEEQEQAEDAFVESDHPRGQPDNPGQFAEKSHATQGKENGQGKGQPQSQEVGPGGGGGSGSGSLEEAQRTAASAAGDRKPIQGLPNKPLKIGNNWFIPGPIDIVHQAAEDYARTFGISYNPPKTYAPIDPERAKRIAYAFDAMEHDPQNPKVKASYDALIKETLDQYQIIKKTGLKIDFIQPDMADPYASSPRLAQNDLIDNNHLWVFPTDIGFGSGGNEEKSAVKDNPMLAWTDEYISGKRMRANDVFRIVHDYFGHFKDGNGFRASGEENAWRSHSAMYSPLARGAMTTETRGQNSWVNYGPYGEKNKVASASDTVFAPQKVGLLPSWVMEEGRIDIQTETMKSPAAQVSKGGQEAHSSKSTQEQPPHGLKGNKGDPYTVASRWITAKGMESDEYMQPDVAAMKQDMENFKHDILLFGNSDFYPGIAKSDMKGSVDQKLKNIIDVFKSNLKFLYDMSTPEEKAAGKDWYKSAKSIVDATAKKYNKSISAMTAAFAVLSPQKDWDMNVSLGLRVADILDTKKDFTWDKGMSNLAEKIWKPKDQEIVDAVKGKKLSELNNPIEKAVWIRTYDEAHNDQTFRSFTPDGKLGAIVLTSTGKTWKLQWQSVSSTAKAVSALESNGSQKEISKLLGERHKVRSFYNNILDPDSKNGDVTIDTHAIGAALLQPTSGSDPSVMHALYLTPGQEKKPDSWVASKHSKKTGISGTYPIYADAYREVAKELDLTPAQLQAVTWQAKRRLFIHAARGKDNKRKSAVDKIWHEYHDGKITLNHAQHAVIAVAND